MTQIYAKRRIDVTINLGEGDFGEGRGTDVTLTGYRCQAVIMQYNSTAQGMLELAIYGLPLEMINRLTRIGTVQNQYKINTILVAAGDQDGVMSVVYQGQIDQAFGNFMGMPEVALIVVARAATVAAVKPVNASSYRGAADVGQIMQDLANTMGLQFVNENVQVQLSNPYFRGTALDQVKSCAQAANINYSIDKGILRIWGKGTAIGGDAIEVSVDTGLIGYPNFSENGIELTTLFNPNYALGGNVDVKSTLTPACGKWNIWRVIHSIASETPGGQWLSQVSAARLANNG